MLDICPGSSQARTVLKNTIEQSELAVFGVTTSTMPIFVVATVPFSKMLRIVVEALLSYSVLVLYPQNPFTVMPGLS